MGAERGTNSRITEREVEEEGRKLPPGKMALNQPFFQPDIWSFGK